MLKRKNTRILSVLVMTLFVMVLFAGGVMAAEDNPMEYKGKLRVGAQMVNEPITLAWMAKVLLDEYTGLKTVTSTEFAASSVLHQAMVGKELDIYVTWTGTQLTGILRYEGPNLSKEETFRRVKEGFEENFNFTWIDPFGFNNTYVMAVRRETAEQFGLKKASDLKPYAKDWIIGGDDTFDTRSDAYPGWSEAYGIEFKDVLPMQYSMMYMAIDKKEVEVIAAYSTDSRIKKLDLVMLEDDLEYFPAYSAAYVVRMDVLEKYPKVKEILSMLCGKIDEETMSALNYRFDEGEDPEDIAREYLLAEGLIKK